MSFRNVYGNDWSENGWRMCNRDECVLVDGPFMNTAPLRRGPAEIILGDFVRRYHAQVAPIVSAVWGWSLTNDVGDSNHLSGTAVDINATQWPWGIRKMPQWLIDRVNALLADYYIDGQCGIYWGRNWNRPDEMHFQLNWREGDPRYARLIAKIQGKPPVIVNPPAPGGSVGADGKPILRIGSKGAEVRQLQAGMNAVFADYSKLDVDGEYGPLTAAVIAEFQRRSHLKITDYGVVGAITRKELSRYNILAGTKSITPGVPTPPEPEAPAPRPIYIYSAAGTGGQWWQGPQFEAAEWCKGLNIHHQPVGYPAGGFLGLMGGDPKISYNDSIANLGDELERLLGKNPDIDDPNIEFWFFGYSQSADGLKRKVAELFGDGGNYSHLRSRINGLILFGDPTRSPGPTKVGNNPPGWGIARWDAPEWLDKLTWSITTHYDMYACATDDTLVKYFYPWFIRAETELPFVIYSAKIIIPALLNLAAPFLGGALGGVATPILSALTGLGGSFIGQLLGDIAGGDEPDPELIKLLSIQGILSNIPQLIKTLVALQGIQTHGEYHLPKPEFDGRTGIQVACDIVRDFRR